MIVVAIPDTGSRVRREQFVVRAPAYVLAPCRGNRGAAPFSPDPFNPRPSGGTLRILLKFKRKERTGDTHGSIRSAWTFAGAHGMYRVVEEVLRRRLFPPQDLQRSPWWQSGAYSQAASPYRVSDVRLGFYAPSKFEARMTAWFHPAAIPFLMGSRPVVSIVGSHLLTATASRLSRRIQFRRFSVMPQLSRRGKPPTQGIWTTTSVLALYCPTLTLGLY